MALLNKLFSSRKKCLKQPSKSNDLFESSCWEAPTFSKDQIRVLVFRECEWRGRKLLFDWKSVKKSMDPKRNGCDTRTTRMPPKVSSENKSDGYTEVTQNGVSYQYLRPRSDVKMLGEMIFGSVEMSYKGETMKIHTIRSPSRIMISKVMPAPTHCSERSELEGSESLHGSISDCINLRIPVSKENGSSSIAQSVPVDVPALFSNVIADEDDLELFTSSSLRSNSSFSSIHSYQRSPEGSNGSLNNLTRSGSFNGLQRRWHRTLNTSMEFGFRRRSDECGGNGSKEEKHVSNHRRTKLGISVIITLSDDEEQEKHFQTFFFSHVALIESYVSKLSMAVERAYVNRKQFVHLVFEGVEFLQQSLYDLYMAPRFPRPVWLGLMAQGSQQHGLCLHFVTEFMNLVESYDTKTTNFFVSTLLTAVLMHHLSWVPTITPPDVSPTNSYHEKHTVKWLDILAKSHPYNPLWVQLGDLYGALGFPCKLARTVIVGNDAELVRRIIYCLTYFIRCSEVYENVESRSLPSFPSRQNVMSASSTSSGSTLLGDSVQLPSFSNASCHDLSSLRVEASTNNSRTFDRRQSELESSSGKGSKSLTGTTRSRTSVDVERQEGEGDDEDDDEEDEVFHDQATSSDFQAAALRVKTPNCEKCESVSSSCKCKKLNRCGVIYGDGSSEFAIVPSTPTTLALANGTETRNEDDGCLRTFPVTRDSGVHSLMEMDEIKKASSSDCGANDGEGNKTKRKVINGKVMFSIGNIPLKEICCKNERESSPAKDVLVCTCGKHFSATGNLMGATFTKVDQMSNGNGDIMHSVNKKLAQLNCFEMQPPSNLSDSSLTVQSCLSSIRSLTYDSGIHSCEESSVDLLASSKTSIAEIRALNVSIQDAKREHVRNVGKSRECLSNGESTDFIGLPGNCSISRAYPMDVAASDLCPKVLSNAVHCKWRTRFDYERTNSMFDEYFDENIELNMLDDESFQQTLKSHREKANAVNRKQTEPQGHKCRCQGSKCDSRDSLLDGQEGTSSLCETYESTQNSVSSVDQTTLPTSTDQRHVLWNTALDNFESSNDGIEFLQTAIELEMPKSEIKEAPRNTSEYIQGFSRSLISNYVDHYLSDFALQGTSEIAFGTRLISDLKVAVQNPVLDEPVEEAICIISNTENWTVELVSSKNGVVTESGAPVGMRVSTSPLVAGMTESLLHLWKLKMSPEFCLMHLEDRLQEFYFKSRLLAEYLLEVQPVGVQSLTSALGLDASDLPLLMAIASTHTPEVTCTYGLGYR